jgi:MOSC domain-containing protein YiiM
MEVISVNVSEVREVGRNGRTWRTAIFKEPVDGRRRVGKLTVEGDAQANLEVHGGPEQAVYAYPAEHYPEWSQDSAGREFGWGTFGENLTVRGLSEADVRPGDRLRIGTTELVVTKPRQPCATFAMKMGDPGVVKRMLETGRCGWYLSVAIEGEIGAGDAIELVPGDGDGPTIAEMFARITKS